MRAVSSISSSDDGSLRVSPTSPSMSSTSTIDRPAVRRAAMTEPFWPPTNPLPEQPQNTEGRRNAIDRGGHRSVATPSRDMEMPNLDSPPASPSAMDMLQAATKEAARRALQDDRSPSPSPEPAPEAIQQHTTPRPPRVLKLNCRSPTSAEKGKWRAINDHTRPSTPSSPAIARRLAKYSIRARPQRMALLPPIDESLFDYTRPHTRYRMCSMHTTKCNACLNKLKSGILFECADCRMHLCQACVERRIEEMGEVFDEHAPNHEGFVEAFLEWKDGEGGNGKEGFVAGNGVVFEVKVYKAKKTVVKEGKGKEKKKVPPKLDLRPPPAPTARGLRVNRRGQVQSRAAPHPLTPYPTESSLPNDLGLPNEVEKPVLGVRGPSARGAATTSATAAAASAGPRRRPRLRRRRSSTYSSGSDSDGMDVLMDTATSIIERTRPDGDAPGRVPPALSEASLGTSVATEDAEAAAALMDIQRERQEGYGWHRRGRGGLGA